MSGFLYFVAKDQRPIRPERLAEWGLSYAFAAGNEGRPVNRNVATGCEGYVFADPARQGGRGVGIYPGEQTWRKMPVVEGRPELWVGYYTASKPTPADLERSPMLAVDLSIRLADGCSWRIPKVRHFDDQQQQWECSLPSMLDYDETGKLYPAKPLAQYQHLWEITAPIANSIVVKAEGVAPVTDEQVQACAIALLQANYVVDVPELVAIGALSTSDSFASIVMAACRGRELLEWLDMIQKKSSDPSVESGSNTSDGAAA